LEYNVYPITEGESTAMRQTGAFLFNMAEGMAQSIEDDARTLRSLRGKVIPV